jgi:competence protein ComEC
LLRRPLIPLLAAFCLGISLSAHLSAGGWPYLLASCLAVATALLAATGRGSLLPLALFAAIGIAAARAPLTPLPAADDVSRLQGQQLLLGGTVAQAEARPNGQRLVVDLFEAQGQDVLPVSGRLLVTVREGGPGQRLIEPGRHIRFPARPAPVRGCANPGCASLEERLAAEGIFSRASVPLSRLSCLEQDGSLRYWLPRLRLDVARLFEGRIGGTAGGLCLALATGSRAGLPRGVQDAFAATGTAHLLAVAGLHLGMVGLVVFFLVRRLVSRWEALLLRVPAQHVAAIVAFVAILLYALLVGWRVPAVRAALMAAAALALLLAGRETDIIAALALAAFAILALSPASLFEPAFQLSFAAIFGLGLAAPRLRALRERLTHGLIPPLRWMVDLFLVSTTATLATAPLVAHHFNLVSLIGPLANLVLVPLVGLALVPLCLAGALLLPLSASLAGLPLLTAAPIARLSLDLTGWFASLPAAALLWPLYGWWADSRANPKGVLSVRYIDVGRGQSALVVDPGGKATLIDAAGIAAGDFDLGRAVIARTLWALRVRQLERVILTHPHTDHAAGLPFILAHFHPKELWLSIADPAVERWARQNGCRVLRAWAGRGLQEGGVRLDVLWPQAPCDAAAASQLSWHEVNEHSLVARLAYGRRAFIFPGDIGRDSELALVEGASGRLASDVLLAPHHGGRASNSPEFLKAVGCRALVFCQGPGTFVWPSREVLGRAWEAGAQVWRTDRQGMITATTDGQKLEISVWRQEQSQPASSSAPQKL